MLFSAGGSSGGRGLISASGIVSPPSPSPPPAGGIRRAPGFPLPHSGIEGIPAAVGRILRLAERPQAAARGHPAILIGGIHAAEPPPPLWLRVARLSPAAAASCRNAGWRGSAPAAAALRGSSSAPFAACRVRSRGVQQARKPRAATSSVFSGAAGSRLRLRGIVPIAAAASMPPYRARPIAPDPYSRYVDYRLLYSLFTARLRLRRRTPRPCGPLRV